MNRPPDQAMRDRALDPARSFIVQAPAGSGKTELLIQRFLRLLGTVDRPERILAITFTRKATREMADRIHRRLHQAARGEHAPDAAPHQALSLSLARRALQQDERHDWRLLDHPARLRIQTIDGLCAELATRDAGSAAVTEGVTIVDRPGGLYREAVADLVTTLARYRADHPGRAALDRALAHLDGDAAVLQRQLADMLGRRDQWADELDGIEGQAQRLAGLQRDEVARLLRAAGEGSLAAAAAILAAVPIADVSAESEKTHWCRDVACLADVKRNDAAAEVRWWQAVCSALCKPRKAGLRARRGLSRGNTPGIEELPEGQRVALGELLDGWHADPGAREAIEWFAYVAPLGLDADDQRLLESLAVLLEGAGQALEQRMALDGRADFIHVAGAALAALGDEEAPGPVLLAEDRRLEHLLMDEFQDTSHGQHRLLTRLLSGWTPGDGRTVFLVGDPMQSIYRFRKADVQLFTRAFEQGRIGDIALEPLRLDTNFRSRRGVIDWVNDAFGDLFPDPDDPVPGSVAYHPVQSARGTGGAVRAHALAPGADAAEAVAAEVANMLADMGRDDTVAVLARKRKQLVPVAGALDRHGIAYQAEQVVPLRERPVVRDLLALARALAHRGDRVSWLALLRAPWCGLAVDELHAIVGDDPGADLREQLAPERIADRLEAASAERVRSMVAVVDGAESGLGAWPMADLVRGAWLRLGGPHCVEHTVDLANADAFLALLREVETSTATDPWRELDEALDQLWASTERERVMLMTIHKAKGLEFDHVIVPALEATASGGRRQPALLRLLDVATADGATGVIVAPRDRRAWQGPSLYGHIEAVQSRQEAYEEQRVLYVAATRARHQLHLFGQFRVDAQGRPGAPRSSPMAQLWPFFAAALPDPDNWPVDEDAAAPLAALPLLRLEDSPEPAVPLPMPQPGSMATMAELPNRDATALGNALHEWLERIHDYPGQDWSPCWFEGHCQALVGSLLRAGADPDRVADQAVVLARMMTGVLSSAEAMAIVQPRDTAESHAEWELLERAESRWQRRVLDRAWRDAAGWHVVDYKSGVGSTEQRAQWRRQLTGYASLLDHLSQRGGGGPAAIDARILLVNEDGGVRIIAAEDLPES